jgi:type III restriction enzyme
VSNVETYRTVLKGFQQGVVENATEIFTTCLTKLSEIRGTRNFESNRKLIVSDMGAVLFEAPTGTGKTLMAGHVVENISQLSRTSGLQKVLWFWFAPFAGLIEQSERTIRTECDGLRVRDLAEDRELTDVKSGDVFVTTWASVAVSNGASRTARTDTETVPSIDRFVSYARARGFAIGVVVDEAHHSFRGQSQAFAFYKDILSPELTILATATPRDNEIDKFTKDTGIANLRRITVSRKQAIDAHLIKEGVNVAVFKAPVDVTGLIDFKKTALKQGVAIHSKIKQSLAGSGLSVVPLMLVQVDSEEGAVEQATQWLKELGFRTDGDNGLIRAHTANEPDPHLSSIAADETVEVLIFKMAVATGFDAPRAFTLVSFRTSRDENFGIQVVGRILRVDRRLQIVKNLPPSLNTGYVLLSDRSSQTGLTNAADKINAVKAELASVSSKITIVTIGENQPSAQVTTNGQISLLQSILNDESTTEIAHSSVESTKGTQSFLLEQWFGPTRISNFSSTQEPTRMAQVDVGGGQERFLYPLRQDLNAPRVFHQAVVSLESADIVQEIVNRFRFDNDTLVLVQREATTILMEQMEIFGSLRIMPEEIQASLAQKEIDGRAQSALFDANKYNIIDVRELYPALMERLIKALIRNGLGHLCDTDQKARNALHKILALRPQQLELAMSEAVSRHTKSKELEPIPEILESLTTLDPARLNLYRVFPDDLNSWERPFAEWLDDDLSGTVSWWHRNPPRKPFSICVPLPGQPRFFPDFVVGVKNRIRGDGILLVETKRDINDQKGNAHAKAQASHPTYGKVMMVYWQDKQQWRTVEYNVTVGHNYRELILDSHPELMTTY